MEKTTSPLGVRNHKRKLILMSAWAECGHVARKVDRQVAVKLIISTYLTENGSKINCLP